MTDQVNELINIQEEILNLKKDLFNLRLKKARGEQIQSHLFKKIRREISQKLFFFSVIKKDLNK